MSTLLTDEKPTEDWRAEELKTIFAPLKRYFWSWATSVPYGPLRSAFGKRGKMKDGINSGPASTCGSRVRYSHLHTRAI
jgi:hypothetical protein